MGPTGYDYDGGDYLVHGLAAGDNVRVVGARTTGLAEEARWRHDLWPVAAAALGRALTGALLLAAEMKGDQRLQLHFVGDGPIQHVTAAADAHGTVRGYVGDPHVHLPPTSAGKLDVGRAIGAGSLHVVRDMGLREPYRSTLPLVSGEIGDDLAHYLVMSEQRPSVVAVGVLVDTDHQVRASGGFLLQLLPGADAGLAGELEARLQALPGVSGLIDAGATPESIVEQLFEGMGVRWIRRRSVRFFCPCSRERYERALIALGAEEIRDMIESEGQAELVCHFCRERYRFSEDDLRRILNEIETPAH